MAAISVAACSGDATRLTRGPGASVVFGEADVEVVARSQTLATVVDMEVTDDGAIWVLNSVEPLVVGFDGDGGEITGWGARGEGPEEFRGPNAMVRGELAGTVWVYDRTRHAFIGAAGAGQSWREVRLSRDAVPPGLLIDVGFRPRPLQFRTRGQEVLLALRAPAAPSGLAMWTAEIVAVDPGDGTVSSVLSIPELVGDPSARYPDATQFLPFPLWDACPDGSLAVYDPLANEVRRVGVDGGPMEPVSLPPARLLEITPDRVFQMTWLDVRTTIPGFEEVGADSMAIYNELRAQLRSMEDQIAGVFPEFADLRCSEGEAVWLQVFDVVSGRMGQGPTWLLVSPEGPPVEVRFPDRFDAFRFHADYVWGVLRDEFDVASVARIPAPPPGDQLPISPA